MEHWKGRVAVVTGASVGIGAAIAKELVLRGMKVVGLARRPELIQELAASLKDAPGKLYPLKADLAVEKDILAAFKWVTENLGGVDVLVNNAALYNLSKLSEAKTSDWKSMLEVNVLGLSICTREAIQNMKQRGVDDGYIFHISSVCGHWVSVVEGISMYCATKHAVTALTDGLRKELTSLKSHIRITAISPGAVDTNMLWKTPLDVPPPSLKPEDVADLVVYALSTPSRVQIHEIIVRPQGEAI
ncbi:dehydrogenase/reductase SDR family member 11-like [Bacillus rossius redtenbacheri]|uniref:dehydrogenase/reductase SDR family member 11-like n=1 Tax=Bacillus rossius redtenbacheri TaxID=93214 RepID=UPI002FDD17BD